MTGQTAISLLRLAVPEAHVSLGDKPNQLFVWAATPAARVSPQIASRDPGEWANRSGERHAAVNSAAFRRQPLLARYNRMLPRRVRMADQLPQSKYSQLGRATWL